MGLELFHPVALESSSAFSQWCHLLHSHFTFNSICSLTPSFLGFLHLARTCSHSLPPHLHDVWCIAIYDASCSGLADPYKSGAANSRSEVSWKEDARGSVLLRHIPFSSSPIPSQSSHTASSDRQGEQCVTRGMPVSCMNRAREEGDTLCM